MNELLGLAGVAALVSAGFAFWSAANVERLKNRFESERHQLSNLLQQKLELLKLESDRIRSTHSLQMKREYEIYESVYPILLKTYYAFSKTRGLNEEIDPFDEVQVETDDELNELRQEKLAAASSGLAELAEIEKSEPFIPADVYKEINTFIQMCFTTHYCRQYPALKISIDGTVHPEHSNDEFKHQIKSICAAIKARLKVVDA